MPNEAARPTFASLLLHVAFWGGVVLTAGLSLMPVEQLPPTFHFWDKAQHTLGFAGLAFLGLQLQLRQPVRVLLGLAAFGVAIEVAQFFTGWRQGDWLDWLADVVGLLMGWVALWLWRRLVLRGRARGA